MDCSPIYLRLSLYLSISLVLILLSAVSSDSSSSNLNGGSYLAMVGDDCLCVATDARFSSHAFPILLDSTPREIHLIGSTTLLGCFGLEADTMMLLADIRQRLSEHNAHTETDGSGRIYANSVTRMVSDILYRNQLLLSPIIAGFVDSDGGATDSAMVATLDGIGAITVSSNYGAVGTSSTGLLAICESLYIPRLPASRLCALSEKCMKMAFQRDILSGSAVKILTLKREYTADGKQLTAALYSKTVSLTDV